MIELDPTSRLRWRELIVLGRHQEIPGVVESSLRITVGGQPLLHHVVGLGPGHPGWDGPAVLGGTKVLGQLVVAGPGLESIAADAGTGSSPKAVWSVSPLYGPGALVTIAASGVGAAETALAEAGGTFRWLDRRDAPTWPAPRHSGTSPAAEVNRTVTKGICPLNPAPG